MSQTKTPGSDFPTPMRPIKTAGGDYSAPVAAGEGRGTGQRVPRAVRVQPSVRCKVIRQCRGELKIGVRDRDNFYPWQRAQRRGTVESFLSKNRYNKENYPSKAP